MNKNMEYEELLNKLVNTCTLHNIKESNRYINFLGMQLEMYEQHLNYLEDTKPLFFQKKKLKDHNKKIKECEDKISSIYLKMGKEVEEIEKFSKNYKKETKVIN